MLLEAKAKAERLLEEVQRMAAEAEATPPPIPPEDLAASRLAMANAVASAERMVRSIQEALQAALDDRTEQN